MLSLIIGGGLALLGASLFALIALAGLYVASKLNRDRTIGGAYAAATIFVVPIAIVAGAIFGVVTYFFLH